MRPKEVQRKHPAVESGVSQFLLFIRSQHLAISMRMIQERVLSVLESSGITDFRASRGWLEKVLRRSGTQTFN